jgi:hypothetical protein
MSDNNRGGTHFRSIKTSRLRGNVQRNWKISKLKVLDKLDEEVNAREMINDLIAEMSLVFYNPY